MIFFFFFTFSVTEKVTEKVNEKVTEKGFLPNYPSSVNSLVTRRLTTYKEPTCGFSERTQIYAKGDLTESRLNRFLLFKTVFFINIFVKLFVLIIIIKLKNIFIFIEITNESTYKF